MKVTHDQEADALCIQFKQTTVTTDLLAEGIAADYGADGRLAGIEILGVANRIGNPSALEQVIVEKFGVRHE